jgi:hypothetical protein
MGLGLHITQDVLTRHGLTLLLREPEQAERGLEVVIRGPLVLAAG